MPQQNNALVEIALALAMAFFSIMILAMVSMQVPALSKEQKAASQSSEAMNIQPPSSNTNKENGATAIKTDQLLIYYDGVFYDTELNILTQQVIETKNFNFLAINPSISALEAVTIRKKVSSPSLVVTLLNTEWLERLKEQTK